MDADEIAIGKRMRKRNLRLDEFVAVKQIELLRNRGEIYELIGARVNVGTKGRQRFFFRNSHTTNGVILFKHQNFQSCSGQVAGTGQAIVPRTDDDRVVMIRHSPDATMI